MATTKFNARHGLSVGSTPIDVIGDDGKLAAASLPDSVVGTSDTQTLTNKRITSRVSTSTGGNYSLNSNNLDVVTIAPTSNITISVDAGSPTEGQKLIFRITSATSYNLTFTPGLGEKGFRQVGVTVPGTTVVDKVMYIGCMYNDVVDVWDIIAYTVLS